jgi:hypothetical protein
VKIEQLIEYWRRQFTNEGCRYGWLRIGAVLIMVCPVVLLAAINYAKSYRELTDLTCGGGVCNGAPEIEARRVRLP